MTIQISTLLKAEEPGIKQVPQALSVRDAIRSAATTLVRQVGGDRAPARQDLENWGSEILYEIALPRQYLGFAMVALSNAFWRARFLGIPFNRRLLLLPHCLRDHDKCAGVYDSIGLNCAGCGRCCLGATVAEARGLGYTIVIAEGTSSVLMKVLHGEADGILGVACMDSLEKSYLGISDLRIPNMAVPLLVDGCAATVAELDEVLALLRAHGDPVPAGESYIPLLRETANIFREPALAEMIYGLQIASSLTNTRDPINSTQAIAYQWLLEGGKRIRPFVTVAAYAVSKYGTAALAPDSPTSEMLPASVRRLAIAIEALHKASLAHDDIEDDEAERYARPTLHRAHGIGPAINIGDYLIGLGYRLIASEAEALGTECVGRIMSQLSSAHLDLCRGQGADLFYRQRGAARPSPSDLLSVYALKTAPAFEAAFAAGLFAAGISVDARLLRRFSTYLGEGYQVTDDLYEWQVENEQDSVRLARELLTGSASILHAFALEADRDGLLDNLVAQHSTNFSLLVSTVRTAYADLGVFSAAEQLRDRLRVRALDISSELPTPALKELFVFLVRVILPSSSLVPGTS